MNSKSRIAKINGSRRPIRFRKPRLDSRRFERFGFASAPTREDQAKAKDHWGDADLHSVQFWRVPDEESNEPLIAETKLPDPPEWEWHGPKSPPEKPKAASNEPKGLGLAFAIGYSFVGPVLGGILIGSLLDGKAGGTWTMVGLLVGTVVAFALLIRLVNKLNENDK